MRDVLSGGKATRILARITFTQLFRGWKLWVALALAALPAVLAALLRGHSDALHSTLSYAIAILALLPPLFVAPTVADELSEHTYTYLWSRPFPRWAIVCGKLCGALPLAAFVTAASAAGAAVAAGAPAADILAAAAAFFAGGCAAGIAAAAIAILLSRHGMVMAVVYLVIDLAIGSLDGGFAHITISRNVRILAGLDSSASMMAAGIWLAALTAGFLALAVWSQIASEPASR